MDQLKVQSHRVTSSRCISSDYNEVLRLSHGDEDLAKTRAQPYHERDIFRISNIISFKIDVNVYGKNLLQSIWYLTG